MNCDELATYFGQFGELDTIVVRRRMTDTNATGLVSFRQVGDIQRALSVYDHSIRNKKVDVLPTKTNSALARTTTIGNANELATSKTSVLELNDDCLNNIFQMLPLSDLLSLAETCSRFKAVASTVFARKHRYIDLNFNNE